MSSVLLEDTILLFDNIISELPHDFNLSAQIKSAKISSVAIAGGHACDIFCVEIPWDDGINKAINSRCDPTKNERGAKLMKVAVKKARVHLLNGLDRDGRIKFMKRHAREVFVWLTLEHPNILPLLGYTKDEIFVVPSLITPWMENGTAREYLMNNRSMPIVINVTKGVTEGLHYLHSKGIRHGDLKADNILVSSSGAALIADFGISRTINSGEFPSLTTTSHSTSGTLRWMARELIIGDDHYDHTLSSDIWSYGMTVYEFLTGKVPFEHIPREPGVIRAIVDCEPPYGTGAPPPVSVAESILMDICRLCWHRNPKIRPTAVKLLALLGSINQDALPSTSCPLGTNLSSADSAFHPPSYTTIPEGDERSTGGPNAKCRRLQFLAHGSRVVTCLLLSHGRIISASDGGTIHVHSPTTGQLTRTLEGHHSGIWALAATKDTLVSGSTDRTVRIWNLKTGSCTHVFGGHTSTIRCLAIVKPEDSIEYTGEDGVTCRERWLERPLIVTGSRDHTLRVWTLPKPGEEEYQYHTAEDADGVDFEDDIKDNPYYQLTLKGHEHAVRALAARGRTLVSGSYDCTVRIWDIMTGQCKWVLVGHTQKVYSVLLDPHRDQAYSGSMDGTVRVWNLTTGQCVHILAEHTSLVALLGLSPSYLVSAAADSTLCVWDPDSGELKHTLRGHTSAVTCFQHDENRVLSGSDHTLKLWDIRKGTLVEDLLLGRNGIYQVLFRGRWCVAASSRVDSTVIDVLDFGHEEGEARWDGEGGEDDESDEDEDAGQADADREVS